MRRREVLGVLGLAAGWPLTARAQPQRTLPVIGFLHPGSQDTYAGRLRAFHRGLKEIGYVDGENVTIEYRWADNQFDRLPALAAELARRPVAVLVTSPGTGMAVVARAATETIPIVSLMNTDPVALGLVKSLARPGGNLTGINFVNAELNAKRLEFLHQLVPSATRIAMFVNPNNSANAKIAVRDVTAAARAAGLQVRVIEAKSSRDIDLAFAGLAREPAEAVFVNGDPLFNNRRLQLALLAARHAIPASYASRDYPEAGGLMSYGTDVTDAFRQLGSYAGRVLKGEKPADMPVMQSVKFELVINHQAARVLGLTVPQSLLVAADEVIE